MEPPPPPPPPPPSLPPQSTSSPPSTTTTTTTTDISKSTPPNPTKIPIRPQKIRKLSSSPPPESPNPNANPNPTTIEQADSSKSIIITTTTPTTTTATKSRRRNPRPSLATTPQYIKPLSSPNEITAALAHLRSSDPLLANLIDNLPPPVFDSHKPPFLALTKSILFQQLANKAGMSIYTRFVGLCGGEEGVGPDAVLALNTQQLKQIGVSGRKASYLYDLANKYRSGILCDESVVKMDDRSLFTMLSMVKGIGSWSVHMFMIFSLHRPDVLPVSDLGVRKGVQLLFGLDELPRPSQMEQLCEKWRPYRSVGAWYMWRFVEGKGASAGNGGLVNNGIVGQQPLQVEQSGEGQTQQPQQQQQIQLQLLEPINSIGNLG